MAKKKTAKDMNELLLIPLSPYESLAARVDIIEDKQDRQRKAQFGKIGDVDKHVKEQFGELHKLCRNLLERLEILERGICRGEIPDNKIIEMDAIAL